MNIPVEPSILTQRGIDEDRPVPRILMSWEDWLTFAAALVAFLSVAMSLQDAHWVKGMPPLWPTMLAGLLIGMVAARTRMNATLIHPIAIAFGIIVVLLMVQTFADGGTVFDRLNDVRIRLRDWMEVVVSGDISNDNLPFVTLVQGLCCLAGYIAAWSIFRWRSAWPAIVPGGVVILANISFLEGRPSGWFILFLFGALVLLARLYLQRRQARWSRQNVDHPDFISLSAIQLTIVSVAILIFVGWQLPLGGKASASQSLFSKMVEPITDQSATFVRLFHNIQAKKGLGLHSFGDYLTVQSDIQLGNQAVAQVTTQQLPTGAAGLLRATSYDTYTGAGWKTADRTSSNVDARAPTSGEDAVQFQKRVTASATIKLLDSSDTLFTVGIPYRANLDTSVDSARGISGDIERMSSKNSLEVGDAYTTEGTVSVATADDLRNAGANYPATIRQRYLQLPGELPARVKQEAAHLATTAQQSTPYDISLAIATYLQKTYPFDLTVAPPPPGRDMVDYFLFDAKKGYFDYNSSAMAVMLRSLGIPARVAVGYVLDPTTKKGNTFNVSREDTFSWVEVYFPTYGWVSFNPSPATPNSGANGLPTSGITNIDSGAVPPLAFNGIVPTLPSGAHQGPRPNAPIDQPPQLQSSAPWTLIWSLVLVFLALVVLALALRISWTHGLNGMDRRYQLWTKLQRAARLAGLRARPYETPREFSTRVGLVVQREQEARQIADAYEEARYGRPNSNRVDPNAAERAYQLLRNTLFGGILRRRELRQRERELDYRPYG